MRPLLGSKAPSEHRGPSPLTNTIPPQPCSPRGRNPSPPKFNLYLRSRNTMTLGEQRVTPTHFIRSRTGVNGRTDFALHSGPTEWSPRLAKVQSQSNLVIVIPPLRQMADVVHDGWTYRFTFGNDTFEWRASTGAALKAPGRSSSGMRLVRLGARAKPGDCVSSEGFEIVAVWGVASWSVSKLATGAFLGSGAEGVLGPRWAVTVVMSALGIFGI